MSADEIQSIRDSLHRIEKAIIGDPAMGHRGIAARVDAIEKLVEAHGRKLLWWSGIVAGASVIITHWKVKIFGS
jgi:hypothetical protein